MRSSFRGSGRYRTRHEAWLDGNARNTKASVRVSGFGNVERSSGSILREHARQELHRRGVLRFEWQSSSEAVGGIATAARCNRSSADCSNAAKSQHDTRRSSTSSVTPALEAGLRKPPPRCDYLQPALAGGSETRRD